MANVTLKNVRKEFAKNVVAVNDFSLEIEDKEFVVLVGPSGCGKTTTLRMIAGLEEATGGELYIGERLVNNVLPKDRDIAMVFQNYALYPHMTVFDNMAFALKMRKYPKKEIIKRVNNAAYILGLENYLKRKPKALSGGQRQRVAIGRAIVREPKVFLMDEPLSNLDAKLRNQMRAELIKLHEQIGTTFIYVTHDQIEAMTLGSRIVVMKDGIIQQVGTPSEIFNRPRNIFVAGFIGTPQMNFFNAKLTINNSGYSASICNKNYWLPDTAQQALMEKHQPEGQVIVGIRPEDMKIVSLEHKNAIEVKINVRELLGSEYYLHVSINGNGTGNRSGCISEHHIFEDDNVSEAIIRVDAHELSDSSEIINIIPRVDAIHLFDKDTEKSLLN